MTISERALRWVCLVLAAGLASCAAGSSGSPEIVRPGAPGEPSRREPVPDPGATVRVEVTQEDIRFMQDMIVHHAQALVMSGLAPSRTERQDLLLLADRIERSQEDEIAFITRWLSSRDEAVPDPSDHGRMMSMPGMVSDDELARLEAASGPEFDRLFLVLMIRHHEGALTMVRQLFDREDSGHEGVLFEFALDVDGDQRLEIARMVQMLGRDP